MLARLLCLLALLACLPARAAPQPASEASALDAATAALCHKQVAVLGEAEHGDARTETFKTELIQRLVARCGYSAVLFEASFYEFVQLDRRHRAGQPITSDALATAVGGLWRHNRTFQPLLPYLAQQASAGTIRLGGFDFQQGGQGQDYGNFGVVAELAGELPGDRSAQCRDAFRDLLFKGWSPERRDLAQACLAEITALPPSRDSAVRRERREMLLNLSAYLAADPANLGGYIARRDREMFANFRRWQARWPAGTKVIVWTATAHAARAPHGHRGFAGVQPFGAYLARRFGTRMFALGFTAQGGTTRGKPAPRMIEAPAADSLEAFAGPLAPGTAVYLDRAALARARSRPGGMFVHSPVTADWSQLLDGVVVFDAEAPAADIRKGG